MPRNSEFRPGRKPLDDYKSLEVNRRYVTGPFFFLNPTEARLDHITTQKSPDATTKSSSPRSFGAKSGEQYGNPDIQVYPGFWYMFSTRANRQGRHPLVLTPSTVNDPNAITPTPTSRPDQILRTIYLMLVSYPVYDVSWLVAYVFTWGSVIGVINAFFSLLPYMNPARDFKGEVLDGAGITAFIGATVFEIGSVFLMLEAVNEGRSGCFGWAVEQAVDELEHEHDPRASGSTSGATANPSLRISPDKSICTHHHRNKHNLVGQPTASALSAITDPARDEVDPTPAGAKSWVWFPSFHELTSHYIYSIGFLACLAQMFDATVFWISGFTALPGIYNHLSTGQVTGGYWVPQLIGGSGFVISGLLFMLETQKAWWKPALGTLGWHIGLWNLIGGIGFTMCAAFGVASGAHWAQEQAAVSTFWGSWAFLIGSVVQWYESLQKWPVEVDKDAH